MVAAARRRLPFSPLGDVACGVQVFQGVCRCRLTSGVLFEPALEPVPHYRLLEVPRKILGLVHRVHEGDARLDGDVAVLRVHGGAAHGQGKGQATEEMGGGEPVAPLALGDCGKLVGDVVGVWVVEGHGDDSVVGEPAVLDGFHVALAVQLDTEDLFIVHGPDNPVAVAVEPDPGGVIDPRRSSLIDAVGRGHRVVVMAKGEVADALLVQGEQGALGALLAPQASGAVRLVGDEDTDGDTHLLQGVSDGSAALVGAKDDADAPTMLAIADPLGDFSRVRGDFPLYHGGADVAVVQGRIGGGVAGAFLCGIIACGHIGAHGQRPQSAMCVLKVLPANLCHQCDGRTEHYGQFALRCQLLDDAKGDASLARAAGEDDLPPRLADGQPAAVRLGVFLQNPDTLGNGLSLHARLGSRSPFVVRIGGAVRAFLIGWGALLLLQVVGDVDQLNWLAGHREDLLGVVTQRVVAIGDNPALCPEVIRRSASELVGFTFLYRSAVAAIVQLPGLALDGDVLANTTADRYRINPYVLLGGGGKVSIPLRPFCPKVALVDVPLPYVGTRLGSKVLEPGAIRGLRIHLGRDVKRLGNDFYYVVALQGPSFQRWVRTPLQPSPPPSIRCKCCGTAAIY